MPGAAYAYGSMTTVLLRSAAVDDREVWTAVIERQLTAVSSEQPKRRNGMVVLAAIVLEYRAGGFAGSRKIDAYHHGDRAAVSRLARQPFF